MEILNLEQGTPEWDKARAGLPTASRAGDLITQAKLSPSASMRAYAAELAAEFRAGEPLDAFRGNKATEAGHELEPEARALAAISMDDPVTEVGFVMNYGAGCSPDGLVGDHGLLEVKCPFAKHWVRHIAHMKLERESPPDFKLQLQFQMWICDREWNELVMYHPHEKLGLRKLRVYRDENIIAKLAKQVALCIEQRDQFIDIMEAIWG